MLTSRQQEIYGFLKDYIRENGTAPTYEAIRRHFGFRSYNAVFKHVRQLEKRGFLVTPGKNMKQAFWLREPVGLSASSARLPLLGLVAAGQPIEAWRTGTRWRFRRVFSAQESTSPCASGAIPW